MIIANPGEEHQNAMKWILRYLRGTAKRCLDFGSGKPILEGFIDANMTGNVDSEKYTLRYFII